MEAYCCHATKIKTDLYQQKAWRRDYWNTVHLRDFKRFLKNITSCSNFSNSQVDKVKNKSQNNLHHVLLTSHYGVMTCVKSRFEEPSKACTFQCLSKVFFPHRYVKYIPWACETFHLTVRSTHSVNEKFVLALFFFFSFNTECTYLC